MRFARQFFYTLAATFGAAVLAAGSAVAANPDYEVSTAGGSQIVATLHADGGGVTVDYAPDCGEPGGCVSFVFQDLGSGSSVSAPGCKVKTAPSTGGPAYTGADCPLSGVNSISVVQAGMGGFITIQLHGNCLPAKIAITGKGAGGVISADGCVSSVTCLGPAPGDGVTAAASVAVHGCMLVTRQ